MKRAVCLTIFILAGGCGGRESGTAETGASNERVTRRKASNASEAHAAFEREGASVQAKGEQDAAAARRDAEELQLVLELRNTDPAEAERRTNEFLTRKCNQDQDARSCERLARSYATQGRYEEAKEAVRAGVAALEDRAAKGDVSATYRLAELRKLDEELDRKHGPDGFRWMESMATAGPGRAPSPVPTLGIGMGSGPLTDR